VQNATAAGLAALVVVQMLIASVMWRTARTVQTQLSEAEMQAADLSQALESGQQALSALEQRVVEQERLAESLERTAAPLIPIAEGVFVVPLLGTVGEARMRRIRESLLEGIERHRSQVALIDLTGAEFTQETAHRFTQVLSGVELMGCQVVLTGIRKQTARDLLDWNTDLSARTCRDLRAGVAYAQELLANSTRSPGAG
jgi:rsbT co-antagonist protein RsbR